MPFFGSSEGNPKNFSPLDLYEQSQYEAKTRVHEMITGRGDCIFIPAYWWYQLKTTKTEDTLVVTYKYDVASSWLQMIMSGIEKGDL